MDLRINTSYTIGVKTARPMMPSFGVRPQLRISISEVRKHMPQMEKMTWRKAAIYMGIPIFLASLVIGFTFF